MLQESSNHSRVNWKRSRRINSCPYQRVHPTLQMRREDCCGWGRKMPGSVRGPSTRAVIISRAVYQVQLTLSVASRSYGLILSSDVQREGHYPGTQWRF
ncbi:hypothetical protein NPIL_435481 [Nephila pilipes]|uniref:Uncharacterized protein n=1 Tax=Nephila pilipes TaxID=299642 RepID=A0A8X6UNQ8_NEPPI|nr:hypothetical protein NPIL_435481 [Nephila pilipes]